MNINITNVGSTALADFPAFINLTYDSDMKSDFSDIRFVNSSCGNGGILLAHELDYYTESSRRTYGSGCPHFL
jgi:UDP-N-acetylglucosamine transferase subunit ALG13